MILEMMMQLLFENLLLCLAAFAVGCAPLVTAYCIWYVVHRVNTPDEPFGGVPPRIVAGLTPHQLEILKLCLGKRWR